MNHTTILALAAAMWLAVADASADIVTEWNEAALDAIRAHKTPPPAATRNLAILHAAVHDALVGIRPTHDPYRVTERAPPGASIEAAASAAARGVLAALYPADGSIFESVHARLIGHLPVTPHRQRGLIWGARVAELMLAVRADDGAGAVGVWAGNEQPGQWRPTASFGGLTLPALAPHWGGVKPFVLASGGQFRPPAPPALHTQEYAAELREVQTLGGIDSTSRTVDQTEIALFWGYGPGTATPPGHWNQVAQSVASSQGNSLLENARMFALLNLALADAAIVSWDCKYEFNYWRPITAIRLADSDGNSATVPDMAWSPLLPTPPFPEYTSGHSTFSGAAAAALALFFGRDDVPFTIESDDLPGVFRDYGGFWEAALESGASRIYGGIHFQSANRSGLFTGALTAAYVFEQVLRPKR